MTAKNSKRKATAPVKKVIAVEEIEKEEESTDEENFLNEINNDDSSDSDGGDDKESSDEGEDFIFSGDEDEDGNIIGENDDSESEEEYVVDDDSVEGEDEDEDEDNNDSYFIDEENDSEVEFESDEGNNSDSGNLTEEEDDNNILRIKKPTKKIVKKPEVVPSTSSAVNGSNVKKVLTKKAAKKSNAIEKFSAELQKDEGVIKKINDGEYRDDTSDEEDIRNTVGNIPMKWYDEYKHIGYDWDAKKIIKPAKRDQLDDFLKRMEDPNFWRTVTDPQTGQDIILSEADIDLIKRINSQRIPDQNFDEYAPWVEYFTSEVEQMPIKNVPDHKRSFIPSKDERKKIGRIVHAIKMGWTKTKEELDKIKAAKKGPQFYMLWETDTDREKIRRIHDHVSAPKRDLPGHAESYNPPAEYLFDEKEMKEWNKQADEPSKRKLHFLPQKFKSLREVPAYSRYLRERFLRCLDLYLCPRAKRMKITIQPEYLIPKLPSPKDLQPFPTMHTLIYKGHTDLIRTISIEPKGEYIVTGSDDTTVKIWEISTARCIKTIKTDDVIRCVAWCPNPKMSLIAVATGKRLLLINPKVGDKMLTKKMDDILEEAPKTNDVMDNERVKTAVQWIAPETEEFDIGIRVVINHFKDVKQVTWHGRGDYFATVMPDGAQRSVLIHQLSKRRSQMPFSKSKGLTQCVLFHPIKPCLFVATQRNIRIYDLVKQEIVKKLLTNSKWIADMAIHPKGDNLLVSTYDKKMLWFDLDLSTKPYQTLRLHRNAVRSVAYHLRYPLFASSSDDRSVIVSHGMVYNDLLQNPLIVPLKKLQYHEKRNDFAVFDVIWHPTQPWLFSTGADATVRLYT